jgi:integrase/recombinase XerD
MKRDRDKITLFIKLRAMFSAPNSLPDIQVVPLTASSAIEAASKPLRQRAHPLHHADLRWFKVEEFLNGGNLAANSRKLYTRELARFLGWTDLLWGELKMRHLALYKLYLIEEVRTKVTSQ